MIVVDASVAVKWYLPEPGREAALKLMRGGEDLIAPHFIRQEVAGAFVRRFREGELPEENARDAYAAWEQALSEGLVRLIPDIDLYEEAVECAFAAKHITPARKLHDSITGNRSETYVSEVIGGNYGYCIARRPIIVR